MGKKSVLKFLIYTFYAVSILITLLLLILPAWDNQETMKVGIFVTDNNGNLEFGYLKNEESKQSSLVLITVYTVAYLCIVSLLNIAVIGLTSLDSSRAAKWLNVILCGAHATGLIFIFFIYSIRYISLWRTPLRNYYLDIFCVLVDFILILLLIMYRRSKKIEEGDETMDEIKVEGGNDVELTSKLSSKKSKKNSDDPQLISEGIATPLYLNGTEYVEPQPTINAKPSVFQSKIVVSDNIVGEETYMDNNGNQFHYNQNPQLEVNASPIPMADAPSLPYPSEIINNQNISSSPYVSQDNSYGVNQPQRIGSQSQFTYAESNPYPVAANTVYKIPEVPTVGNNEK